MMIETNGVKLQVRDNGQGELSLVFLHYWGGSSRTWHQTIDALPQRYRTIAIDHRGWGESEPGNGNYGIADLAADAEGVIESMGIQQYVLIGQSMGGKVAQLMASRRPQGLVGLVLVAPASPCASPIPLDQRQFIAAAYASRESILAACDQVLTARALSPAIKEQVVEDSLRGSPDAKFAWPMKTILEDITKDVARIRVPTLVIAGEFDQIDPVDTLKAQLLSRIHCATMCTLPGVGHLSPLEAPIEIAREIEQFIGHL